MCPFLTVLKIQENLWFFGVFRGYEMETDWKSVYKVRNYDDDGDHANEKKSKRKDVNFAFIQM